MARLLRADKLGTLVETLRAAGYRVVAPKREGELVLFREIASASEIAGDVVNTDKSFKEYLFPCSEKILGYRMAKDKVELDEPGDVARKTVILGCRPCDAASLPIIAEVFKWDYQDEFFLKRLEATTVVSSACATCDSDCFCTSVGLAPNTKQGSDVLLTKTADGGFLFEAVTPKGEALAGQVADLLAEAAGQPQVTDVKPRFDLAKVKPWLDRNFENPFWRENARRCLGCGACAFVCPACHCFDIVDEAQFNAGNRMKNWDSCGFGLFTLHTSGHNPRHTQDQRWRQRMMHKFKYYVEKFQKTSCVGCGRCMRTCPVDMNLAEMLTAIAR